jgi:tol-pal system protein YbgF
MRWHRGLKLIAIILLVLVSAGCAGNGQIRDQPTVNQRLDKLERQQAALTRQLQSAQQKLNADTNIRLDNLERELKLLSESIEDSLARPEEISNSTSPETEATLARIEQRLQKLEQLLPASLGKNGKSSTTSQPVITAPSSNKTTPVTVKVSPKPGAREKALYDDAYAAFKRGNLKTAKSKFKKFIAAFPNSDYKVNALFWIGECYYKAKDYAEAIIKYDEIVAAYPQHPKAASALLKQGFAFLQLGDTTDGKLILEKVVRKYPGSDQAEIAKRKLKIIK